MQKTVKFIYSVRMTSRFVDKKQHKSQFKNLKFTFTQCQKNFADCVMIKFKFINCDLYCFMSTTTMSPLHCI